MRELFFAGPGDVSWREAPAPTLQHERDVLVRPLAVARCDLDAPIAMGLYPMPTSFAMGHEMVGEVIARGDAAGDVAVGDCVIVPFQISCGDCRPCRRGFSNACTAVPPGTAFGLGPHGGIDVGGALADVVRVPYADHLLLPLPDGLDPVVACGIPDNVSDGYRCVAGPLSADPGAPVLVAGGLAQSVGLYAAAVAIALGSERVVYVDHDPVRLGLASRLGAEVAEVPVAELRAEAQFPIVVDACGFDQGRDFALRSTAPCGHCTSVTGGTRATSTVPLRSMYLKGITYDIGRVHARATAPAVLDLVAQGRLDPGAIIGSVVSFDDAPEAMFSTDPKVVFVA